MHFAVIVKVYILIQQTFTQVPLCSWHSVSYRGMVSIRSMLYSSGLHNLVRETNIKKIIYHQCLIIGKEENYLKPSEHITEDLTGLKNQKRYPWKSNT